MKQMYNNIANTYTIYFKFVITLKYSNFIIEINK